MPVSLWSRFVAGCLSLIVSAGVQAVAPKAEVMIWRLDCGQILMNDASPLSDTGIYDGQSRRLSVGCYLIRHGKELMLWDAGLPTSLLGKPIDQQPISPTLAVDLPTQLARLGIRPSDITRLALSHYHSDHAGQAATFPNATLMIGAADWTALHSKKMPFGADPALLAPWLNGKGKVDTIEGDRDVFGDGSVIILATPGHTPGSAALLVRLPKTGPLLLSGDVAHLEAQWALSAVPTWNTERADSLASMNRLQKLATNLGATIIVQHDPADISKLATFPEASR
ncbi:N-acyl homoserine lactonase family protein [Sphingomonas aerolata]|uniref:N-acyl homoserine lactonase family protein n=1 Tax=Sphingomonas aerolata TaxID=185951 RepID=UPI00141B96B4|nr:N-acyl homoserine lactonase family protein [Sphingomonas aerolata]NII60019.1 glyoxylase-like metal-dependent hydrolase (beta-lactamase superfamily II) [Sphingomonas aerolata]